jgi:hypothetical protein
VRRRCARAAASAPLARRPRRRLSRRAACAPQRRSRAAAGGAEPRAGSARSAFDAQTSKARECPHTHGTAQRTFLCGCSREGRTRRTFHEEGGHRRHPHTATMCKRAGAARAGVRVPAAPRRSRAHSEAATAVGGANASLTPAHRAQACHATAPFAPCATTSMTHGHAASDPRARAKRCAPRRARRRHAATLTVR